MAADYGTGDAGANHAVKFRNQEFYVQTRITRDGSRMLLSEIFHRGRLLDTRRGAAFPEDGWEGAEAVRRMQSETEKWLIDKLAGYVARSSTAQPRADACLEEVRSILVSLESGTGNAELLIPDLKELIAEIWKSHCVAPWLTSDAAVALLCVRSFLVQWPEQNRELVALMPHLQSFCLAQPST